MEITKTGICPIDNKQKTIFVNYTLGKPGLKNHVMPGTKFYSTCKDAGSGEACKKCPIFKSADMYISVKRY